MNPHFHVHTLVPGGALADQGQTWNAAKATYLFPVGALSTVFRAKYRDGLKQLYAAQSAVLHRHYLRPGGTPCFQTVSQASVPKEVDRLYQGPIWRS